MIFMNEILEFAHILVSFCGDLLLKLIFKVKFHAEYSWVVIEKNSAISWDRQFNRSYKNQKSLLTQN